MVSQTRRHCCSSWSFGGEAEQVAQLEYGGRWLQFALSAGLTLGVTFNPFGRRLPSVGQRDSVELYDIAPTCLPDNLGAPLPALWRSETLVGPCYDTAYYQSEPEFVAHGHQPGT